MAKFLSRFLDAPANLEHFWSPSSFQSSESGQVLLRALAKNSQRGLHDVRMAVEDSSSTRFYILINFPSPED